MFVLNSHITIGDLTFNWVNTVEVESSWELLTDTAKIVLPANVKVETAPGQTESLNFHKLKDHLKNGDKVEIKVGYDDDLNTIFKGYVSYIKPRVPIEVYCEDEMMMLKKDPINDSLKNTSISKLADKHFAKYETDVINIELGNYYIPNLTGAKLLEQFKSDFGLQSFFRGDTLVIGKRYNRETANVVSFKLDYNIISDELEFKTKDQVKLKVKAISNNEDGTKTEIELGDADGEIRTLNFYNVAKSELKKVAEAEMERLVYDGWRGSFTAFGEPLVFHGDIVELVCDAESDKTGRYWVDAVSYEFGVNGFRQNIKLGAKA